MPNQSNMRDVKKIPSPECRWRSVVSFPFVNSKMACASLARPSAVAIFRKIATALGLANEAHAILELTKGKLTTDRQRHSGEGIFFTSRMFDWFGILSHNLYLGCRNGR